jgi:hypothetical protein
MGCDVLPATPKQQNPGIGVCNRTGACRFNWPIGPPGTVQPKSSKSTTVMMVQTLGDKLDESMKIRKHNADEAAGEMGVTTSEVLLWKHDMQIPDPMHVEVLLDYLFVDEPHLRGLMLRSQMRRIQQHIRN